jgi:hypothetical protein
VAKRFSQHLAGFTLAALVAVPASAHEVRLLARMGLDGGGSRLAKVTMSDGSTRSLAAGGLFTIAAGLLYAPAAAPIAIEATIGYKVDDVTASNGQLKFDRWPLELLASYRIDRHRIGGGLTRHGAPTYRAHVDGSPTTRVTFDDAFGGVLQYAYGDGNGSVYWDVGARITLVKYTVPGDSVSGNSLGAFVSLGF